MASFRAAAPRSALPTLAATVALLALAPTAAASPLEDISEGDLVFTGPATPHASSIFLNPAALGWAGRGLHLYLVSSLRLDQLSVDRYAIDPATGAAADGPSADPLTLTPSGLIAATTKIGDRGHVGVAIHTPIAERFPAGGDALGYHSLGGYLYATHLSMGGSFQVDRFVFGFGLSLNYSFAKYRFLRDTALEGGSAGVESDCGGAPCGLENPAAAERVTLVADDYDPDSYYGLARIIGLFSVAKLGLSAGIAMEVPNFEGWWLTLAYVGPPGVISDLTATEGSATIEPAARDGGETVRGEAEIRYRLPQSITLAGRGPLLPGWMLVSSLRWQDVSRHQELDLRLRGDGLERAAPEWDPRARALRDTFQLQVGLEMDEGRALRLGGRARFETGATTAETNSPLAMDTHNLGLSGGLEWRLGQHVVVALGYDVTGFLPTDRETSAFDPLGRIGCVDSGYAYDRCEAVRDGRALPSAAGAYRRLRHQAMLGLRWDSL
jgi:long-subunit fatty acid transport protein